MRSYLTTQIFLENFPGNTKCISFHPAPHTFATAITLKNGVPIETVSKMLVHKKISATQIYAEVGEEKFRSDMASIEKKLNNSETILVSTEGEIMKSTRLIVGNIIAANSTQCSHP